MLLSAPYQPSGPDIAGSTTKCLICYRSIRLQIHSMYIIIFLIYAQIGPAITCIATFYFARFISIKFLSLMAAACFRQYPPTYVNILYIHRTTHLEFSKTSSSSMLTIRMKLLSNWSSTQDSNALLQKKHDWTTALKDTDGGIHEMHWQISKLSKLIYIVVHVLFQLWPTIKFTTDILHGFHDPYY